MARDLVSPLPVSCYRCALVSGLPRWPVRDFFSTVSANRIFPAESQFTMNKTFNPALVSPAPEQIRPFPRAQEIRRALPA